MGTNVQILAVWIDVVLAISGKTPEVKVWAQVPNGKIKPSPTEPRHDRANLESRDQTQLFPTPSVPMWAQPPWVIRGVKMAVQGRNFGQFLQPPVFAGRTDRCTMSETRCCQSVRCGVSSSRRNPMLELRPKYLGKIKLFGVGLSMRQHVIGVVGGPFRRLYVVRSTELHSGHRRFDSNRR